VTSPSGTQAGRTRAWVGILIKIVIFAVAIAAAGRAGDWVAGELLLDTSPSERMMLSVVIAAMAVYFVLMALPYCPGIEIGLALMVVFGAKIVPLIYVCTVSALTLTFLIGRLVPSRRIIGALDALHLSRARDLLREVAPLGVEERLQFLLGRSSWRPVRFLLRYRYVALALAINTPGNIVVGGGGGLALVAGVSRLFSLPAYALTIMLAVSPVPIAVMLMGV